MLLAAATIFIISLKALLCQKPDIINRNSSFYKVTSFNERERSLLFVLYHTHEKVNFLNSVTNEAGVPMSLLVKPSFVKGFEDNMDMNDIDYIKESMKHKLIHKPSDLIVKKELEKGDISKYFYNWKTIAKWLDLKCKKYIFLYKIGIGVTSEGRELSVIKISDGIDKMSIFLMGGEEGKDWLSVGMLLNLLQNFAYKKENLQSLINRFDIYILPCLNPDGYQFSTEEDRLWTKNRKIYAPKRTCPVNSSKIGIFLPKNWYITKILRSIERECDPLFNGPKPLSEVETLALSRFLDSIALKLLAFINIVGYDNIVTIPFGNTRDPCNNNAVLMDIIECVLETVHEEHNISYQFGPTSQFYYNFSGGVADWVKYRLNTPIVYTFHMTQKDYIFPSAQDIGINTNILTTMVREVVMLADSIYNPLFDNAYTIIASYYNIIVSSFILIFSN